MYNIIYLYFYFKFVTITAHEALARGNAGTLVITNTTNIQPNMVLNYKLASQHNMFTSAHMQCKDCWEFNAISLICRYKHCHQLIGDLIISLLTIYIALKKW